jgi:transposase
VPQGRQVEVEEQEEILARVAAIDVGKASGMVCTRVPHQAKAGARVTTVWDVAATTSAIMELADRLVCQGIQRVVVESTSDYWRPFVYLLQAHGLLVWLVNARDVKQVPGRPKTDRLDAVWLAKLNERGMLRPSFIPPAEIRRLRDLTRLRVDLTEERSRHKQRVEKLLEDALIKLSTVATDIFGVSGRAMLEALIAGERDPKVLAELARGRLRVKRAALVEALTGQFSDHHARLARILLDQIDGLTAQIDQLTTLIEEAIAAIPTAQGPAAGLDPGPTVGAGDPAQGPLPAVQRLDEVPGIGPKAAQVIIAELGLDMGQFPTPGHLVSWAKIAPQTIQSGAKRRAGPTGKGQPVPAGHAWRGRRRGRQNRHLPRRALPAAGPPPRQAQGAGRHRPLHPGHRLAPTRRPHRPLPRPGRRLPHQPHRHGPQDPQPGPPTRGPRPHRHPATCRIAPTGPAPTTSHRHPQPGSAALRRVLPPAHSGGHFPVRGV